MLAFSESRLLPTFDLVINYLGSTCMYLDFGFSKSKKDSNLNPIKWTKNWILNVQKTDSIQMQLRGLDLKSKNINLV